MELTQPQKQIIKTWLIANAGSLNDQEAANSLNAVAVPDYFVLKPELGLHEFTDTTGIGDNGVAITQFTWGGAQGGYISRSQGERDAFRLLFNATEKCYPKLANVRAAMADIFSGSGVSAVGNRDHFRAVSRRQSTVAEKLLAEQTVGGPAQTGPRGSRTNPDTLGYEAAITAQDVVDSYNS